MEMSILKDNNPDFNSIYKAPWHKFIFDETYTFLERNSKDSVVENAYSETFDSAFHNLIFLSNCFFSMKYRRRHICDFGVKFDICQYYLDRRRSNDRLRLHIEAEHSREPWLIEHFGLEETTSDYGEFGLLQNEYSFLMEVMGKATSDSTACFALLLNDLRSYFIDHENYIKHRDTIKKIEECYSSDFPHSDLPGVTRSLLGYMEQSPNYDKRRSIDETEESIRKRIEACKLSQHL